MKKRKSIYEEDGIPTFNGDEIISTSQETIQKIENVENFSILEPLLEKEVIEKPKKKTKSFINQQKISEIPVKQQEFLIKEISYFDKFRELLKIFIELNQQDLRISTDIILQMYVNIYGLEKNFDVFLDSILLQFNIPDKNQGLIFIVKKYYYWTTGNMFSIINVNPQEKKVYDTFISLINQNLK